MRHVSGASSMRRKEVEENPDRYDGWDRRPFNICDGVGSEYVCTEVLLGARSLRHRC